MDQTADVTFPSPDDRANAPVWENYVAAQTTQACLGLVPQTALAVGVEVNRDQVLLRFRLSHLTPRDEEDMSDIAHELSDLLGPAVRVEHVYEIATDPGLSPYDGVTWIFRSRTDD